MIEFNSAGGGVYTGILPRTFELIEGKTYIIGFDGVVYTCVAYLYNGMSVVGDYYLLEAGSDSEEYPEPFAMMIVSDAWSIATRDTGRSHTLSIKSIDEDIKKIDEKYLPSVKELNLLSSTEGSSKKFKITVDDTGAIKATEVTI